MTKKSYQHEAKMSQHRPNMEKRLPGTPEKRRQGSGQSKEDFEDLRQELGKSLGNKV